MPATSILGDLIVFPLLITVDDPRHVGLSTLNVPPVESVKLPYKENGFWQLPLYPVKSTALNPVPDKVNVYVPPVNLKFGALVELGLA
jgi:hypothetical protein